jgi:heat shock protein 5
MTHKIVALFALIATIAIGAETKKREVDGPVIGIDLGTTYSCVGIFKNGRVEIIPNEFGNRITPSFVAFTDDERLVGESAKNQALLDPKRSIYVVKRLMGRKFDDVEV